MVALLYDSFSLSLDPAIFFVITGALIYLLWPGCTSVSTSMLHNVSILRPYVGHSTAGTIVRTG